MEKRWSGVNLIGPANSVREATVVPDDTSFITDENALRALHHQPLSRATDKVLDGLDKHCLQIIALSPFSI